MNRIDRLSAILIQLQSKKVVRAQEIADRFDISLRTVYRDIRALEQAGIPIGAEAGTGYFLNASYHLPPVMFTKEEASAFLVAEKLIMKMSDSKVNTAFESALFKIKSVLRVSEKEYLDCLSSKIEVFTNVAPMCKGQDLFLMDITTALANKRLLEVEYTAHYSGQCSNRTLEPISLCNYGMRWHLIAYCHLRQDYRDFRLDRVSSLTVLEEQFSGKNQLSLNAYFKKIAKENSLFEIVLKVQHSMVESMASSKYWFGLIEELDQGDYYLMRFANSNLKTFAKWVLSLEDKVEIMAPQALTILVKNEVALLHKHYK